MRPSVAGAALFVGVFAICSINAQEPSPSVSVGFGIDTTITDVRDIVSLARAYLAKPDSSARSRGLWSVATEFDRRVGDTAAQAYQGFAATVAGIIPAEPGDSVYVVKILYAEGKTSLAFAGSIN